MILLHNGNWKHSVLEEGIRVPGALKIALTVALFTATFFISGCDTEPLKPNTGVTDFWEQIVRPESRNAVSAVTYTQVGELIIAQQDIGLLRYSEDADGFFVLEDQVSLPDNRITELFSDSTTGFIYAGTFGGALYRSTDFGGTWRDVTPAFDEELLEEGLLNYCAGIAASPDYELFAAFSGHGIFYSTDFGTTWSSILGPPNLHGVTSMALTSELQVYIGTQSEGILQGGSLAGVPFWTVTTGLTPHVTALVASDAGAFIGTDEGKIYTWLAEEGFGEATGDALPGTIMDMIVSPGGSLYAATDKRGIWRMGGDSSEGEVNIALLDQHTRVLALDPEGYLLVGTATEGVFRSVFPVQFYDAQEGQ